MNPCFALATAKTRRSERHPYCTRGHRWRWYHHTAWTSCYEALIERGYDVMKPQSPHYLSVNSSEGVAKEIQWEPSQMALAFALDRLDHVQREIEPAMAEGKIVLSDRYVISSLVYQSLELPIDWVRSLNQHAPEPDLTLLVDLDVSGSRSSSRKARWP